MPEVKVTKKPAKVSYLSTPTLSLSGTSGATVSASWKNPVGNTDGNSASRASNVGVVWNVTCWPTTYSKRFTEVMASSATSATLDLGQVLTNGTQYFYPTGKAHLTGITVTVHAYNSVGLATDAKATLTLSAPAAPALSAESVELDGSDGTVSCDLTVPEQTERAPWRDVRWQIVTYDSKYPTNATYSHITGGSKTASDTLSVDVPEYQLLGSDNARYVRVDFKGWTRGFRKDSDTTLRRVYLSKPKAPTVLGVEVPSTGSSDKITVRIKLNATTAHPTTGCRLQVLRNVSYTSASQIPSGAAWESADIQDDGDCVALVAPVADCVPEPDTTAWVRVKAWNLSEDVLTAYSQPYRLRKLETKSPTAEDDKCVLDPLERDGTTSILAVAKWGKNGATDDSTGTEFTWSTDELAWASTEDPMSYQTTRNDGAISPTPGEPTSYSGHADLHIRSLEPGTRVWVRARRYLEGEDATTYGPWSAKRSVYVGEPPTGVELSVASQLATGRTLYAQFAVDGSEDVVRQARWILYADPRVYHGDGQVTFLSGTHLASGTGGSAVSVPWKRVKSVLDADGHPTYVDLVLEATWGGVAVRSQTVRVQVVPVPKCRPVVSTVTAQPASIGVICSTKGTDLSVVVTAVGCSGADGVAQADQEPGDCVWSALVASPEWGANGDSSTSAAYPFACTVQMDAPIDLRDGARYRVGTVVSSEGAGVVRGATSTATFRVQWSHQAPTPGAATVTPYDVTDSDGNRRRYARIVMTAPAGAATGDVYDVWRVTPDGPQLIAAGKATNATVRDEWAPFGDVEHAYRVCTRTADGDLSWADFGYVLAGNDIRIDFDGTYVELPYDVALGDAWQKDFESRAHLTGERPEGYWNQSVKRRASLSAEVPRGIGAEVMGRLRMLAMHAGPCLVRLPNGCCFEADVEVGGLDESFGRSFASVSLSAIEVAPSGAYYEEA